MIFNARRTKTGRAANGEAARFVRAALVAREAGCILWPFSISARGYAYTTIGRESSVLVHRHMCRMAHGEPFDESLQAAHTCGVKSCVNPQHLYWASQSENERDKERHGRTNRGARNAGAKLTEDDVRAILASGKSAVALASDYPVSQQAISDIRRGATWRHISQPPRPPGSPRTPTVITVILSMPAPRG